MSDARNRLPSAIGRLDEIVGRAQGRSILLFLDFDGTLSPIVPRPEDAALADGMAEALRHAGGVLTLAVVSGRGLDDVRGRVGIDGIAYAGSHGFEILDTNGRRADHAEADRFLPALDRAEEELRTRLAGIDGAIVERKRFAIAVHYRLAPEDEAPRVEAVVNEILARHPDLRRSGGKKIYELRPNLDWHKGKAVLSLLGALGGDARVLPVYIGDDETDEDAFAALRGRGVGILVGPPDQPTAAGYVLDGPDQVRRFIRTLAEARAGSIR